MKRSSIYARVSIFAFIAACLLLAFLFTLPRRYIAKTQSELSDTLEQLEVSINSDDPATWPTKVGQLTESLESSLKRMKLFLHHSYTYELDLTMQRLEGFAAAGEASESLAEIESIKKQIEYLLSIETFDLFNLF